MSRVDPRFLLPRAASDGHVLVTYLAESRAPPEVAAVGLCREQSISRFSGASLERENTLIRDHAAKLADIQILSVRDSPSLETYVDLPSFGSGDAYTLFIATIAFPLSSIRGSIADLINTIAGEPHHTGYFSALKILDLKLPPEYTCDFKGPRFGVNGIRNQLAIHGRPLLCGPVKPSVGLSADEFAAQALKALNGGIDIVKDDELLVDPPHCPFEDRVRATMDSVKRVEDETGRKRFYVAHISAEHDRMRRYCDLAHRYQVDAVMVSPMIVGFPSIQWLSSEGALPIFSHNACMTILSRVPFYGVSLHVLVQLQRLAGADVVITPSPWGTFVMSEEDHRRSIEASLDRLGQIAPAFPAFAGGKSALTLNRCLQSVGNENFILIVGAALFEHPLGVEAGARALVQAWEAIEHGIELDQYASEHAELQAAINSFRREHAA